MLPYRAFRASVAIVVVLAALPGCTGDQPTGNDRGETTPTTTVGAAGEPSLEALLAAPAEAMEALKANYPDLVTVDTFALDGTPTAVYERHGYVQGGLIHARTGAKHDVAPSARHLRGSGRCPRISCHLPQATPHPPARECARVAGLRQFSDPRPGPGYLLQLRAQPRRGAPDSEAWPVRR